MDVNENPYDFNGEEVQHPVRRDALLKMVIHTLMDRHGSGYLLGGKGNGEERLPGATEGGARAHA